ncbi:MAG: hypothetical protein ACSHWP_00095 [Pseudoalteromonas sp.]
MTDFHQPWLSSKDTKKLLKISDYELMHQRETGVLKFKNEGEPFIMQFRQNAAYWSIRGVFNS